MGSTGVSLAMCAAAYGCRAFIAMPDDAAIEKAQMLQVGGRCGSSGGALRRPPGKRCCGGQRCRLPSESPCVRPAPSRVLPARRWARRCSGCAPCPSRTPTTLSTWRGGGPRLSPTPSLPTRCGRAGKQRVGGLRQAVHQVLACVAVLTECTPTSPAFGHPQFENPANFRAHLITGVWPPARALAAAAARAAATAEAARTCG